MSSYLESFQESGPSFAVLTFRLLLCARPHFLSLLSPAMTRGPRMSRRPGLLRQVLRARPHCRTPRPSHTPTVLLPRIHRRRHRLRRKAAQQESAGQGSQAPAAATRSDPAMARSPREKNSEHVGCARCLERIAQKMSGQRRANHAGKVGYSARVVGSDSLGHLSKRSKFQPS